jgi:4-amino-4-deoxy-L-arabinose transferase-like glycosyltransferase
MPFAEDILSESPCPLKRNDYLLLALFSTVVFIGPLVCGRVLTGHESVLPESTREMLARQDWLVPRMGGEPWLERPPLTHWIMAAADLVFADSDNDRVVRVAPIAMAVVIVLLAGWLAGHWYGRMVGLLSGLILSTMWEFCCFASDPEADIFLCATVTAALAVFARLECTNQGSRDPSGGFFGRRSRLVMVFFLLLGLTNLAKGLIFGTLMVLVPVSAFLIWSWDLRRIRRYLWLWGGLVFLAVSLAWPVAMYLRYPEILDFWRNHYLGRLYQGYLKEPVWYYGIYLPYVLLPWTLPALLGLWRTRSEAFRQGQAPARFLWCWALSTPIFFSIPDGKHHHYLLYCMAPWAIFAADGAIRIWQAILRGPAWLHRPALGMVVIGLPIDLALFVLRDRIPGPAWLVPAFLLLVPLLSFACCWSVSRANARWALAGTFGCLAIFYWTGNVYETVCLDRYRDDSIFLQRVRKLIRPGQPLLVTYDERAELETFWVLFYSNEGASLLPRGGTLEQEWRRHPEVYVLGRAYDEPRLAGQGDAEIVLQSRHTRFEASPAERRTLFRVRAQLSGLASTKRETIGSRLARPESSGGGASVLAP